MQHRSLLLPLCALVLLAGCGKEVGRIPFTAPGTATASLTLAAGEVAFWTDIQVEYLAGAALDYKVELQQAGATVGMVACNPLGQIHVKTSWVETSIGGSRSRSGMGKMACSVTLAKGGPTTVKATLSAPHNPPPRFSKADLVVKQ